MLTENTLARLAEEAGLATPSIVIRELPQAGREACEPLLHAELKADLPLPAASMIKVPIAAALCAAWDAGAHRRDERVTIVQSNMTTNDAESPFVPGYAATLEQLGRLMITRSDNVATNTLIDVLGREAVTAYAHSIGLTATYVHRKLSGSDPLIEDPEKTGERNAHPARDSGRLLELIALNKIAGAQWLFQTLLAQEWKEKLVRGLREGDRFAHKTGDTSMVMHNGGILDTAEGKRYVLVVYTSLTSTHENDARLQAFMKALRPSL